MALGARHGDLLLGYCSAVLAELDDVTNLVLQVCLHSNIQGSSIIHCDPLKLSERVSKRGDWFQLIILGIDVNLSKMFVRDIKQTIDVPTGVCMILISQLA